MKETIKTVLAYAVITPVWLIGLAILRCTPRSWFPEWRRRDEAYRALRLRRP